jgi:hypothetical protein
MRYLGRAITETASPEKNAIPRTTLERLLAMLPITSFFIQNRPNMSGHCCPAKIYATPATRL